MSVFYAFLCVLFGGSASGQYDIAKSFTIPGWIVILVLFLLLIFGSIAGIKLFKKFRGKLK